MNATTAEECCQALASDGGIANCRFFNGKIKMTANLPKMELSGVTELHSFTNTEKGILLHRFGSIGKLKIKASNVFNL